MVEDEISLQLSPSVPYEFNELALRLSSLFSLENLEKDYSMVMSMDQDLWVELCFVASLECIKVLCNDRFSLIAACNHAGLEVSGEFVRKKIEIPRKSVYVRNCEELEPHISGLKYEYTEKEYSGWVVHCFNEDNAINVMKHLKNLGLNCGLDYVNPYVYLLSKVLTFIKTNSFIAVDQLFYLKPYPSYNYSLETLKKIYQKAQLSLPTEFKTIQSLSIIRQTPIPIESLTN